MCFPSVLPPSVLSSCFFCSFLDYFSDVNYVRSRVVFSVICTWYTSFVFYLGACSSVFLLVFFFTAFFGNL